MLEVKNITKEFEKKVSQKETIKFLADNDISFDAKEGEVVGILGPNGAGKTTLLRMIAGIMNPTSGEVIVDGKNHKDNSIEIKKEAAMKIGIDNIRNSKLKALDKELIEIKKDYEDKKGLVPILLPVFIAELVK